MLNFPSLPRQGSGANFTHKSFLYSSLAHKLFAYIFKKRVDELTNIINAKTVFFSKLLLF